MFDEISKDDPAAYADPLPSEEVFHPTNASDPLTRFPVLPSTVTDSPLAYSVSSTGTEPLSALLASYITEKVPERDGLFKDEDPPPPPPQEGITAKEAEKEEQVIRVLISLQTSD